jgi:hypothetical protein
MPARINTHALRQIQIESGSLGILGSLAHPLGDEGDYVGIVSKNDAQVAAFRLRVDGKVSVPQVDVDLAGLLPEAKGRAERHREPAYVVTQKGYLVLLVSQGPGGFSVSVEKVATDKSKPQRVYDSRSLQRGDVFIVTPLRPGSYDMTDSVGKAKGHIRVAYPEVATGRYEPPAPVTVTVTERGFNPAKVELRAAQSVVFQIESSNASLIVNLAEPDEGPYKKGARSDSFRWTNPTPPGRRDEEKTPGKKS